MRLFTRILAGVAGLLAIVFGLMQIFGSGIPNCDGSNVEDTVRDIALSFASVDAVTKADDATKAKLKDDIQLSNIAEASWDKDKKVRACTATVNLKTGDTPVFDNMHIAYTLSPSDKSDEVTVHVQEVR